MNLLFICSRNQWRSPTAETVFKNIQGLNVRSAGTEPSARIRLNAKTIIWADKIFVMEKKHKDRILERFPFEFEEKEIIILDIPDEYQYMDSELIEEIETKVNFHLSH
ncbi:MAG: protein tyrosine phosphatase [Bacteroidota bacterium]|nr:protein tyrosine phosphatase [Bacteroidota bacterium]